MLIIFCLMSISEIAIAKSDNPLLDSKYFSVESMKKLVCKPDPHIVFEQTLKWEIEYLEDLIIKFEKNNFNNNEIENLLVKKGKELAELRDNCIKKFNNAR